MNIQERFASMEARIAALEAAPGTAAGVSAADIAGAVESALAKALTPAEIAGAVESALAKALTPVNIPVQSRPQITSPIVAKTVTKTG